MAETRQLTHEEIIEREEWLHQWETEHPGCTAEEYAEAVASWEPLSDDTVIVPRDLLESLVSVEACQFDHHGGCQAHLYLTLEPGEKCPQQELKELIGWDDEE
jgi:hypothetical protein